MLLEREKELDLLKDLLGRVGTSGGKVVLIRGEAGIGKSSLVKVFLESSAGSSHVHLGFCDDLETPQPFGPFWDIAREESTLQKALRDHDRQEVLEAVVELLSRGLRSNVMVIEDTHWSDEATLDAIRYMGRRIARTKGLLLLTYRDGEVDPDHPLRKVIGDLPFQNVVRIELRGLSRAATWTIVAESGLDPDRVWEATHGNPFLVTEMATARGDEVPSSVRDSVMARVARLSSPARSVLRILSVIPERVRRSDLAALTGASDDELAECERHGLLAVGTESVAFRHELIRRAIETSLTISENAAIHKSVLAKLPSDTDPSRLVHHARGANDIDRLVEYAPLAARAAAAVGSNGEASALFRTVEPYLGRMQVNDRAATLFAWAEIEYYLGNNVATEILERAIDLYREEGNEVDLARALTLGIRVMVNHGQTEAALEYAAEAIRILEPGGPSSELIDALSKYASALLGLGEGIRAEAIADRALAMAELTGDDMASIISLNVKGTLAYVRGQPGGLGMIEQARNRAERGKHRFEEVLALIYMAVVAVEIRDLERASDFAQRARDTAMRYEIPILEAGARSLYAEVLLWRGDWAAAEDLATETLGSDRAADTRLRSILGVIRTRSGRSGALENLELSWSMARESDEIDHLLRAASGLAERMWLVDETNDHLLETFLGLLHRGIRLEFPWPAGLMAFWLWKLGVVPDAPAFIPEPYAAVIEGNIESAASFWENRRIPYERALALMCGDPTNRLEALEILETLGATAVAAKVRKELRNEGIVVGRGKGRATRTNEAGLTARQAEILHLLDEGLSNTEIADRLFVSPRTVENHVSAVLAKFDSSTRDEAVFRARAAGLITS